MPNVKTIRAKGHAFERELASHFRSNIGLDCWRSSLTQKFGDPSQGNSDLHGLPHLAVEAKRVERLDFPGAYRQAATNANPDEMPVVINRRNRQRLEDAYVVISLAHFTDLYRAYLMVRGDIPLR